MTLEKTGPVPNGLACRVCPPAELTAGDRQQMYRLMAEHYQNVDAADFDRDLAEKEWVIVTSDSDRGVLGFTTLMRLVAQDGDLQLVALFSGDTILDPDVWGARGWARALGRLAGRMIREIQGPQVYWLLLTATPRTYRFLPTFVNEYYPRSGVPTPAIYRRHMEQLARQKFPHEFDAAAGIVRTHRPLSVREQRVELSTADPTDEYAAFFERSNPGYLHGDYLVCIADLSPDNYTRLGHKFFDPDER